MPYAYRIHLDPRSVVMRDNTCCIMAGIRHKSSPYGDAIYYDAAVPQNYMKEYVDGKIGDISLALDELHNYAQAIIGGAE